MNSPHLTKHGGEKSRTGYVLIEDLETMELSQVSTGKYGPMLNAYLYDTNSVQDRLLQINQSGSGKAEQPVDGKIVDSERNFLGGGDP